MNSRLTLNLSDNDALSELLDGREPGSKISFKMVEGEILENTSMSVTIAVTSVDHSDTGAIDVEDESDDDGTDDDDPKHEDNSNIGKSVKAVMARKGGKY